MNTSKTHKTLFIPIALFLLLGCDMLSAEGTFTVQSETAEFVVTPIVDGLSRPWSFAFLPRNTGILITERTGALLLFRNGKTAVVSGVPRAAVEGQGGMLDVVLSPNYTNNSMIFLSYSEAGNGGLGTAVAKAKLVVPVSGNPRLDNVEVIFRALPKSRGGVHFGSRLAFDSNGLLYISLGERGSPNRAQDTSDHAGSVIRINTDGTIPATNPYADGDTRAAKEIFSYGHRNVQGMARNPETGDVWSHEHGPKGGDEVNILISGANYGWPLVSYGVNYNGSPVSDSTSAPGIQEPLIYWVPSIAPSGMAFYQGEAFPQWRNNILVGALAGQHLRRLELQGNKVVHQEVLLKNRLGRIRDVRVGSDGYVYLISDSDEGVLYRLSPKR